MKRISISIEHMSSKCEDGLLGVKMAYMDSLFESGIVGIWVKQIVPHQLDMGMVLGL